MAFFIDFAKILLVTCRDVLPIIVLITGFQLLVLRQPIPVSYTHLTLPTN